MNPKKTSQVLIEPYDEWNQRLRPLGTISLILVIITVFYHPIWLAILTSVITIAVTSAEIGLIVLNARKKRDYLRRSTTIDDASTFIQ